VFGGVVVEGEEHVEVAGDLGDCLGPLGAVVSLESLDRGLGVLTVFGVPDLRKRGLCGLFGSMRG